MKTNAQSTIVIGTLTGVLLILVLALTSIYYLLSLHNKINQIEQRDISKVVILHKMGIIIRERSLRMYAMYVSDDVWIRDEEFTKFYGLGRDFIQLRDDLMRLGLQPGERKIWDEAITIIRATEPLQESIVNKLYVGDKEGVIEKINLDVPQETLLLKKVDKLLARVQSETSHAVRYAEQQFVTAIRLLIILTVVVISLSLTIMVFVRRRISSIEASLYEEKERAQLTLQNTVNGIIKTDSNSNIISINPAAEHISGWTEAETLGNSLGEVLKLHDRATGDNLSWHSFLADISGTLMPIQRYLVYKNKVGDRLMLEISVSPIFTSQGKLVEYAFIFRDVTFETQQADEVSWQATHDPLTQVFNRYAAIEAIKASVSSAQQMSIQHAVLYLDLDDFKNVNDRYGHAAGDELLIGICREMEHCVRKGDRLGRMGGDEFAILLQDCDMTHAVNIAEKLRHSISSYCFQYDEQQICCSGLSIGISMIDKQTADWKMAVDRADQACYNAKRQGKNQVSVA